MNICKGLAAEEWLREHGVPASWVDHRVSQGLHITAWFQGSFEDEELTGGVTLTTIKCESLPLWEKDTRHHGLDKDTGVLVAWYTSNDTALIYLIKNTAVDNSLLTKKDFVAIAKEMGRDLGVRDVA
jgi:hypothetical protein